MATVAWLVFHRKFRRARVFFMQKGDTKTVLDQSFGTLMTGVVHITSPLHPSLSPSTRLSRPPPVHLAPQRAAYLAIRRVYLSVSLHSYRLDVPGHIHNFYTPEVAHSFSTPIPAPGILTSLTLRIPSIIHHEESTESTPCDRLFDRMTGTFHRHFSILYRMLCMLGHVPYDRHPSIVCRMLCMLGHVSCISPVTAAGVHGAPRALGFFKLAASISQPP